MKPRTKKQKEVAALSKLLPIIKDTQYDWGFKNCFAKLAYVCKDEAWCSECGNIWISGKGFKKGDKICCPNCGKELRVIKSRKKSDCLDGYMTIARCYAGYEVLRHVYIQKCIRKGIGVTWQNQNEVCQQWFDERGGETIMAKSMNMGSHAWVMHSDISLKVLNSYSYYGYDKYDIFGDVCPGTTVTPLLRKYGLKNSFHGLNPSKLIRSLITGSSYTECLIKTKQYALAELTLYRGSISYKWAINICNRNHYIVKDADLWIDYLDLLNHFKKDTHNAFYVCPKDLKKAHDKLKKKRDLEIQKIQVATDIYLKKAQEKELRNAIHNFYNRMLPYMGIRIHDGNLMLRPLQNVTEFYKEGKAMHHCVYALKYFGREDCLILSARVDGKRAETVEVNLKTYQVVQSRAVCNGTSEYHDRILQLIRNNMNVIRQCAVA